MVIEPAWRTTSTEARVRGRSGGIPKNANDLAAGDESTPDLRKSGRHPAAHVRKSVAIWLTDGAASMTGDPRVLDVGMYLGKGLSGNRTAP